MKAKALLNCSALALLAGALLHVVGLLMGPEAVKFLGAPPEIVQSVADKTFYGPAITLAIAALLAGLAVLAWRAKGLSHKVLSAILWLHVGASFFVLTIGLALGLALFKTTKAAR